MKAIIIVTINNKIKNNENSIISLISSDIILINVIYSFTDCSVLNTIILMCSVELINYLPIFPFRMV